MGLIRTIKGRLFCVYVCLNMLLCSLLFFPWVLPRETISGLVGRWWVLSEDGTAKALVADVLRVLIDALYFWEPNHCVEVFRCEHEARKRLYPEQ